MRRIRQKSNGPGPTHSGPQGKCVGYKELTGQVTHVVWVGVHVGLCVWVCVWVCGCLCGSAGLRERVGACHKKMRWFVFSQLKRTVHKLSSLMIVDDNL